MARIQDSIASVLAAKTVRDAKMLERGRAPFRRLAEHYPKYLFSLDDDLEADDGIRRLHALDWPMGRTKRFLPRG